MLTDSAAGSHRLTNVWRKAARAGLPITAGIAIVCAVPAVLNDFVYDDVPIIRDNAQLTPFAAIASVWKRAYWPPPFIPQLYRPLTMAALTVERALGGGAPLVFRLCSCLLYVLCAVCVLRLAARFLSAELALAIAVLFAVHPVHVESIALAVNQAEMLVTICAALMVIVYLDAIRDGEVTPGSLVILCVLYLAGGLSKESGLILPALLVLCHAFPVAPRNRMTSRRTAGVFGMLAIAFALMLLLRVHALDGHSIAAIPQRMLIGMPFAGRALMMLQFVPTWARLLCWPVHLEADYALAGFHEPAFGPIEVWGFVLLLATVLTIIKSRQSAPLISFGLSWCLIGLLPVSNLVPTGILVAERTLLLPSVGFLLAVAGTAQLISTRWRSRVVVRCGAALFVLIATLGAIRSIGRLRAWNSEHLRVVPARALTPDVG